MRLRMRERFQTEGELDGLPPHALLNILRLPEEEYCSPWRLVGRRTLYALGLILGAALLTQRARAGYTVVATFIAAVHKSTIALSTTGYGDVTPVSQQERLTTALIVTPLRIVFLARLVGTTLTVLTKESRQTFMIRRWRKRMRNHTIVIGYGTKGRSAVAALLADGVSPSQ